MRKYVSEFKDEDGKVLYRSLNCKACSRCELHKKDTTGCYQEALKRLGEYEETGLTPEMIWALMDEKA